MKGIRCDANDHVTNISLDFNFPGHVSLAHIPPHVRTFYMFDKGATGSIETEKLPKELTIFLVEESKISGSIDMTCWAPSLLQINISKNALLGSCNLAALPRKLEFLLLNDNQFTGEISLDNLPPVMLQLFLENNVLSGSVTFTKLPETLITLSLIGNKLTGYAVVPKALRFPKPQIHLDGNHIADVVDERGEHHPDAEHYLPTDAREAH